MIRDKKLSFADFYSEYGGKDIPEKQLIKLCWIEAQKSAVQPICKYCDRDSVEHLCGVHFDAAMHGIA